MAASCSRRLRPGSAYSSWIAGAAPCSRFWHRLRARRTSTAPARFLAIAVLVVDHREKTGSDTISVVADGKVKVLFQQEGEYSVAGLFA